MDKLGATIQSSNKGVKVVGATWDLRKPNKDEYQKDIEVKNEFCVSTYLN